MSYDVSPANITVVRILSKMFYTDPVVVIGLDNIIACVHIPQDGYSEVLVTCNDKQEKPPTFFKPQYGTNAIKLRVRSEKGAKLELAINSAVENFKQEAERAAQAALIAALAGPAAKSKGTLWEAQRPSDSGVRNPAICYDKYRMTAKFLVITHTSGIMSNKKVNKVALAKVEEDMTCKQSGVCTSRWEITFKSLKGIKMVLLDEDYKSFQEALDNL